MLNYQKTIPQINDSLRKTGKAIISLGCSFVEGMGALDDIMYEKYEWDYLGPGHPLSIKFKKGELESFKKEWPNIDYNNNKMIVSTLFSDQEQKNAFVNVLCHKYFDGSYTPINFGMRGCGNRAAIKELHMNPEINWDDAKEIVVVYCPSGLERFDFINDSGDKNYHWKCMWPHDNTMETGTALQNLWSGYKDTVWSEKFGVLEQISHVQELLTWCKFKNARLIITPGFDRRYDRELFNEALNSNVTRNSTNTATTVSTPSLFGSLFKSNTENYMVDLWPWDMMFYPDNHDTFAELSMAQEPNIDPKSDYFFQFQNNRSPNGWMTPCSHPGQKGHDLFAKLLFDHIIK